MTLHLIIRSGGLAWIAGKLRSVFNMANLWMCCLLIRFITFESHPSAADVPGTDFRLQMPDNDTDCKLDPEEDRLQGLCNKLSMFCFFHRDPEFCGPGLCLYTVGGDEISIGALLPQLPAVDNITSIHIIMPSQSTVNLRTAKVCLLSNLQFLNLGQKIPSDVDDINYLSQLRELRVNDCCVTITRNTFRGLDHLRLVNVDLSQTVLPADAMMQLVHSRKERLDIYLRTNIKQLDVWPLCMAQKQQQLYFSLDGNRISDFENTLSLALCNIEESIETDAVVSLRYNMIIHVSDIAKGWGFSSLHHFIITLIRPTSATFPIWLAGNPFACDCVDLDLYQMLRDPGYNASLTNLASLTCKYPQKLKGRRFDSLLDSELNCDPPSLLLILDVSICGAVTLLASLGFLFYDRIRLCRRSGHKPNPLHLD